MILIILLVVFAVLAAWIVKIAGWRFAAQRLGGALLILVIVTFGTSALLRLVGVDDAQRQALEDLGVSGSAQPCVTALGTGGSIEAVNACVEERGLDKSVFAQYAGWLGDTLSGDLGYAFYKNQEPLTDVLRVRAPRSLWLFLYSQFIALAIAVPLGVWSAYQAGKPQRSVPRWALPATLVVALALGWLGGFGAVGLAGLLLAFLVAVFLFVGGRRGDATINVTAFVLLSVPVFVLAETLRYYFAIKWGWYRLTGYAPWHEGVGAHLRSLWLPAVILGLAVTPVYLRLLRADMVQNLQQDFVAVAKAKGMSNRHILFRHVLRPSTLTLLTVAGLNIAQLVNGAIVVEFIFDLDGLGDFLIEAVARREFFAVQTMVAIISALFILANTIVDVLYTTVDPRVNVGDER